MNWNLQELKKSSSDKQLAGICGGLGKYTPVPSWLWRAAFATAFFIGGIGLVGYIALWFTMPSAASPQ